MKQPPAWFRMLVLVLGTLSPRLAAAWAWRVFWTLPAPMRLRPDEEHIHHSAIRTSLEMDGRVIALYEWGDGPRTVLLVHGWGSRASRFTRLVERLVADGYRVVSFDAPGHGESTGNTTNGFEFVSIIAELGRRSGRFDAIVGHSLGALTGIWAKRLGADAQRVVTVGGAHSLSAILNRFAEAISLPGRATRTLRRRAENWGAERGVDLWRTVVAELDPTDTATPLLVVHDAGDGDVPLDQAMLIAEAHTGHVQTLVTDGLGHNRILADPGVIDVIAAFVAAPVGAGTARQAR